MLWVIVIPVDVDERIDDLKLCWEVADGRNLVLYVEDGGINMEKGVLEEEEVQRVQEHTEGVRNEHVVKTNMLCWDKATGGHKGKQGKLRDIKGYLNCWNVINGAD